MELNWDHFPPFCLMSSVRMRTLSKPASQPARKDTTPQSPGKP